MNEPMRSLSIAIVCAAALVASEADAKGKRCKTKGKAPEVFVEGKTPVRRGPGLNYAVASFLERGRCAPYSEVSLDKAWVLVDVKGKLGWVPTSRLAAKSRERISGIKVESAPVGSAQSRAYADVTQQTVLLERPDPRSPARRVLPQGLKVLPLAKTEDGLWVHIRDERGDLGWIPTKDLSAGGLAELPNADMEAVAAATTTSTSGGSSFMTSTSGPVRSAPTELAIEGSVFGAALLPVHSLDSNGAGPTRRYDVSALAPGTGIDLTVSKLGPLAIRVTYIAALLTGVSPEENPNIGVGGFQQDASLSIGFPIDVGAARVTPAVGYALGIFDFDALLPGQSGITFVSTQTHAGTAGARAQYFATKDVRLEGDANLMVGVTSEGPAKLGQAGLTFGGIASAGVSYYVGEALALTARYALNYRTTSYSGAAGLDETITDATLVDFTHGALIGMTFAFVP